MNERGPIRLLVADDHEVVRQVFADVLAWASGVEVIGLAADGVEAVHLAEELHPDVVLMDFEMPRLNGAEATRRITATLPEVRVVGLSTYEGDAAARPMLAAGAAAHFTKPVPVDELLRAVRSAAGR